MDSPVKLFISHINLLIFKFINDLFAKPSFDIAKTFINETFDPNYFYYQLSFIALVIFALTYSKRENKQQFSASLINNATALATLFFALAFGLLFIDIIKHYTSIPRPFCSLENVAALKKTLTHNCFKSFPSGHMAYNVIVAASLWGIFNRFFKILSVICITLVGISRMASAAHFPMDLLGAIIVCLPLTLYIRHRVHYYIVLMEEKLQVSGYVRSKIY